MNVLKRARPSLLWLLLAGTYAATGQADIPQYQKQQLSLDPVVIDGSLLYTEESLVYKLTLNTQDTCSDYELSICNNKDYQLHLGQLFTLGPVSLGNDALPLVATYKSSGQELTVPNLVDRHYKNPNQPERRVNATFSYGTYFKEEDAALGTNPIPGFKLIRLEELTLNQNPEEVGALQMWDGQAWIKFPTGPEHSLLTIQNGRPTWAKHYQIGDVGPHGGTVFYVSDNGLHGLEAAPKGSAGAIEGTLDPKTGKVTAPTPALTRKGALAICKSRLTQIGTGRQNTYQLLQCNKQEADTSPFVIAAKFKLDPNETCYFDKEQGSPRIADLCWYLPSRDELMAMRSAERLLHLLPTVSNSQSQSEADRKARTYFSSSFGEEVGPNGDDFGPSKQIFNDLGQLADGAPNMRAIRDF